MYPSTWGDTCCCLCNRGSPTSSLFFFFSSLIWPFKISELSSHLLVFQLCFFFSKNKFLIFILGLFVKFQFVFNFRIESIIVIYNFFFKYGLIIMIMIFNFGSFCEFGFCFQFLPLIQNSKLSSYLYFILNFIFILLIAFFLFHLYNWFFLFNHSIFDFLRIKLCDFSRREAFSWMT
jgi:hypothetical protein